MDLFPLQDLNLSPHQNPIATITPKIEPKLEPLDEQDLLSQTQTSFPNTDNGFSSNIHETLSEENLYSEFNRISQLFKTAFRDKIPNPDDSQSIVPVPNEENTLSAPRRRQQRSSDLVRVSDLSLEDNRYFRSLVRRTRMVYDSLRIFVIYEEDKRRGIGMGKRARGDLRSASILRDRGMWLNRDKRIVGPIPGVYIGDLFFFRMELCVVGLHGQIQAGIDSVPASQSSNGEPIATSIIVSGGYEDDEDTGDVIIYTGQGGQDKFSRQSEHQKLQGGNLAMERSMHYGIEVRVIRGFKYEGSVSGKVYVYDGLYKILDTWFDVGKSGFGVYKYKLVRMDDQPEMGSSILKFAQSLRARPLTVRPMGYISLDLSMSKETVPIFLYNDMDHDHEPIFYEYLAKTVFPPFAYIGNVGGCDCVSGCLFNCFCTMKNGGEFPYDRNGILLRGKPLVFECGSSCSCPMSCPNRVTQHGVRNRLEVFRSKQTGWGVRSLDLIQSGAFICEYSGIALTSEQVSVFTMNGDSLVYPCRFTNRWTEWGDLSRIYSDYVLPSYPSPPPLDFAMDVSRMRNVSSYISHSSSPNVMVQFVLYDHSNLSFPRVMVFAMENIPPLRELSLDYGVTDECDEKLRICN